LQNATALEIMRFKLIEHITEKYANVYYVMVNAFFQTASYPIQQVNTNAA
jgi:hypothetical protein